MTRLDLVKAAERAGMKINPFGEGEHRQIVSHYRNGSEMASVILWATGDITNANGWPDPDHGRSLTIDEAADLLGLMEMPE